MKYHELSELISLWWTVPTVVLGAKVVLLWGNSALKALKMNPCDRTSSDLFIIGVFIGFLGSIFDNLYWSIHSTADYLNLEISKDLMKAGVYFNIFFRQLSGTLSAYFHIKSYYQYRCFEFCNTDNKRLSIVTTCSIIIGLIYCIGLFLNK